MMEMVLVGFGPLWKGVGLQHTRGLFGPSVNRWSIKQSPNGTKLDRRSTGSKPRPLSKSRSNPEMFSPHTRKKGRNDHTLMPGRNASLLVLKDLQPSNSEK